MQLNPRQDPAAAQAFMRAHDRKRHTFRSWYEEGTLFARVALPEMGTDFDYVDGKMLSWEDEARLRARNQPDTTIPKALTSRELVMGIYDTTKMDPYLSARGDWSLAAQSVEALNDANYAVSDCNRSERHLRRCFSDMLTGGLSWVRTGLNPDPTQEEVYEGWVDFRDVVADPLWREADYSDARYLFHGTWYDVDEAVCRWPAHRRIFESATGNSATLQVDNMGPFLTADNMGDYPGMTDYGSPGNSYGWRSHEWTNRKDGLVLVHEVWYYQDDVARFLKNVETGEVLEIPRLDSQLTADQKYAIGAAVSVSQGRVRVVVGPIKRCRRALICGPYILEDGPSPYDHNRIPYVPFQGYRDYRSGVPYGLVRPMRKPLDAFNRAFIKLLHTLATRQVLMEKGSGDVGLIRKQISDPSAVLVFNNGALQHNRVRIENNLASAEMHLAVMKTVDGLMGDMSGGLELRGQQTNADSGRAIALRQQQGNLTLSTFFENFAEAKRMLVEQRVSLIRQAWTFSKWVRVTNAKSDQPLTRLINAPGVDGGITNDIHRFRIDVVYDRTAAAASARRAFADKLMDLFQRMPPFMMAEYMPLVVDLYDLPRKHDINVINERIMQKYGLVGAGMFGGNMLTQGGMTPYGPLPSNVDQAGNNNRPMNPGTASMALAEGATRAAAQ